jgi:hypothetical protein
MSDPTPAEHPLTEIDDRQNDVLKQLDELDSQIKATIGEFMKYRDASWTKAA